jgi:tryptophanase
MVTIADCPLATKVFVRHKFDLNRNRRVYTQSHFDYVLEVIEQVYKKRKSLPGFRFTYQAPFLRHFTARFEVVG